VTYRIALPTLTLNDLRGDSPVASLFSAIFRAFMQQMTRF